MNKRIIRTDTAPAAIGVYSQAVSIDNARTVYISGQIPLDPVSMNVVSEKFEAQAHQVFKNLAAVAAAAGGSLMDAVKLNVFLTDLNDFASLNEIMDHYIQEPYPARAAVQVAALPKSVSIEIDAVLCLKSH